MNKQLQIFKNEKLNFEIKMKLDNGDEVFDLETVAKSLGIIEIKNNKKYVMWRRINQYLKTFGTSAELKKGDFISEPMVYKLAFKANNDVAENFQDWLAVEVLPSIRKTGSYKSNQNSINEFKGQLTTFINDMFEEKMKDVKEYYKIKSKSKVDISSYIKKRLGILRADDEYEQVKARVFLLLGISKWEDLDVDSYKEILPLIDESIRIIKLDRPQQINMWE